MPHLASTPKQPARPESARRRTAGNPVPLRRLARSLADLVPGWPETPLLLAYSGGMDSRVLLDMLVRLRREFHFSLRVVHVNHHLQAAAGDWQRATQRLCRQLSVPVVVRHARGLRAKGASLEASAREARYRLLASELRRGECLLTAQHRDDQLETVLLQLFRGAGVAGLAAMPERALFASGWLLRPLLTWSRQELERLATDWALAWSEDPSNLDERFDRNFLRRSIVPLLRQRWPSVANTVARSAQLAAEAAELIEAQSAEDVGKLSRVGQLDIAALQNLPAVRQAVAVRHWLRQQGIKPPDQVHLRRILREVCGASPDRHPAVLWPGGMVWRVRGHLLATARGPEESHRVSLAAGVAMRPLVAGWRWRSRKTADGIAWRADSSGAIDGARLPAQLEIRRRRGGERLRPAPRAARRALKDLLRESGLPAAQRASVPLVFANGELLAVADRFVNYDHPAVGGVRARPGRFVQGGISTTPESE